MRVIYLFAFVTTKHACSLYACESTKYSYMRLIYAISACMYTANTIKIEDFNNGGMSA